MTKWILVWVVTGDLSGASRPYPQEFVDEAACLQRASELTESGPGPTELAGRFSVSFEARCLELPAEVGDDADELLRELREAPRRVTAPKRTRPLDDLLKVVVRGSGVGAAPVAAESTGDRSDRD